MTDEKDVFGQGILNYFKNTGKLVIEEVFIIFKRYYSFNLKTFKPDEKFTIRPFICIIRCFL
jgi:hypothetical protein